MTHPDTVTTPAEDGLAGAGRSRLRDRVSTVDQIMTLVAAVLLPLGLVMVFFAWYGASRTPYLFEQVPYLISGGLLGLGLVVAGGFVLFGSWIARTSREQGARDEELLLAVRALREELSRLPGGTAEAAVPAQPVGRSRRKTTTTSPNGARVPQGLVATARGSMLHRPDCAIVSGRDDLHPVADADAERLQPCRLCAPLDVLERA